jgi:hypothetical protein
MFPAKVGLPFELRHARKERRKEGWYIRKQKRKGGISSPSPLLLLCYHDKK